ncbi:hypothetical protein M900_A0001, partial [Bacteriovorax sp. Seq25_V]
MTNALGGTVRKFDEIDSAPEEKARGITINTYSHSSMRQLTDTT